jgi:hypothetical protein
MFQTCPNRINEVADKVPFRCTSLVAIAGMR